MIPQKRTRNNNNGLPGRSVTGTSGSSSSVRNNSSHPNLSDSNRNLDSVQPTVSFGSGNLPDFRSISASPSSPEVSIPEVSIQTPVPQQSSEAPRRTGRSRKPPDRYGEWITSQQSVVDNDQTQIWYV